MGNILIIRFYWYILIVEAGYFERREAANEMIQPLEYWWFQGHLLCKNEIIFSVIHYSHDVEF